MRQQNDIRGRPNFEQRTDQKMQGESTIAGFLATSLTQPNKAGAQKVREDSEEMRRQETRNKFKNAFQDQMITDLREGEGGYKGLLDERANLHVTKDGALTEKFRTELRQTINEESILLEAKIKKARPADQDLFGIKRRFCEVCEEGCSGYEPTKVLFGGKGEFPTFCRHCNCPAHFHKVEQEPQQIPEALTDLITGKNIQSQDLNYNCLMAAFMIRGETNKIQTTIEIARLIQEEGIEILTSKCNYLSEEEAFFLRNRVIGQSERRLAKTLSQDFQRVNFETEIKKKGEIDSLNVNALNDNNSFLMERLTQIKEFHMKKMRQSFGASAYKKGGSEQQRSRRQATSLQPQTRPLTGNLENNSSFVNGGHEKFDPNESINQRDISFGAAGQGAPDKGHPGVSVKVLDSSSDNSADLPPGGDLKARKLKAELDPVGEEDESERLKSSLKKTSSLRSASLPFDKSAGGNRRSLSKINFNMTDVFKEIQRRESIMPRPSTGNFKLRYGRKTNDQKSKKFVHELHDYKKAEYLVHALETNPLLRDLCQNKILIMVLNSATTQGLQQKITGLLRASQITTDEAILLYASTNKVMAMEDCIQFSPELFRLSKSIIVSEPIIPFMELMKANMAAQERNVFSDNLNVQSDYIREKMRTMNSGLDRQNSQRQATTRQASMRHQASIKQQNSLNPYRQQVSSKKTQYHDLKSMTLQKKLTVLDKVNNQQARTITVLGKNPDVSPIRKTVTFKREQTELKPSQSLQGLSRKSTLLQGDEDEDLTQLDWVKHIKEKGRSKKDSKLKQSHNILQFNYGVMQDFFAYSATCVQYSLAEADLSKPVCPAGIRGGKPTLEWKDVTSNPVNLFAIAKVGVANLIMPNTLDIKLANYQDFDSYVSLSDYFFPDSAKSQHTVIVLRPSIVKNGLNELLLKIVRANEFLVLKRKIRMLTKAEVAYLFRAEKIEERNSHLYFNMMLAGPSEVVVVSKISAVYDCNTLFNGANPYGRRRLNYLNEDRPQETRKNVDSIGGMFEITPFTCFSEFVDLEDFLIRNSKIKKFRRANQNEQFEKTAELLYQTKLSEIRREANLLQRDFNVVGYTANTVEDASREICIFSPSLASIQEVCLILNPIYNEQVENAMEVLVRANFVILQHEYKQLTDMQVDDIFGPKYGFEEGALIIENVKASPVHCFHLAKLAGDTEMRELFRQSDLQFEDHFCFSNWQPPFKPSQIPYLFFFMDTELTFEMCMLLLYNKRTVQYTGEDFLEITNPEITRIIQTCLLVTVGDKLKQLLIDNNGTVKQQSKLAGADVDKFEPLNKPPSLEKIEGTMMEGCFLEPQVLLKSNSVGKRTSSVAYIAEADHHGLFELRFHRLAHMGDRENSDDFPAKQIQFDAAVDSQGHSAVIVEAMHLFERFASLSFYYNEVNKLSYNVCPAFYKFKIQPFEYLFEHVNMNLNDDNFSLVTDEFFVSSRSDLTSVREHKVHPEEQTTQTRRRTSLYNDEADKNNRAEDQRKQRREVKEWRDMQSARRLNRVYEVEEHMGSEFLEELARLHQEHLNILRHNIKFTLDLSKNQEQQKSLPAYIYGLKLAQMIKQLEIVKCFGKDQLRGAGKIRYNRETKVLQGELPRVTQSSYFDFDRKRYLTMLSNFKGGWGYYLSVLEIEIIESKLMFILDSLTFKYTRQPQFLTVVPDRLTSTNLRISEKIKILNPHATEDYTTKFFKPLSEDLIDPNRELDVRNHVDSVLQTLNHSMLQKSLDAKLKLEGTSIQQILDQQEREKKKEYSIHKDCALVGFDAIARRPKHHLIASVLWLLDFNLRKVNRKSEFFIGDRNRKIDQIRAAVEEEYDEVLDILKSSILANYAGKGGEPEVNDALDIVDLKEGGYETEFERHMRKKNLQEELKLKQIQEQIEDEKRRRRSTMSLEELITTEVRQPADEFKKQQRKELEEFLNMRAGLDKDGTEFMQMLERSKMHFGPYAIQLAEEFFKKQMKMFQAKIDPSTQDEQEKISFVKMEYFLYGIAEADRLVQQLKSMEVRINKLAEDADNKAQDAQSLRLQVNNFQRVPASLDAEGRVREVRLRKSQKKVEEAALKAEQDLKEQRHEISAKECELLMVFRELMSYDYYVPDLFFDKEMLTRKKENKVVAEKFVMPLKTFWRPIELDEYYEHDLKDKRYMKKVNPTESIDQKIGQYLAKPLRETILRQDQDRIARLREGGEETSLYFAEKVKRKENLIFDKYMSHGQRRQDAALFEAKKIIDHKTSKKPFEADMPFHFNNTTK